MYTKPLTRHSTPIVEEAKDLPALRRLLTAAALNTGFCSRLLKEPMVAIAEGFGGETFLLSDATLQLMVSIRTDSLPDFIWQLDGMLSNRLLAMGYVKVRS